MNWLTWSVMDSEEKWMRKDTCFVILLCDDDQRDGIIDGKGVEEDVEKNVPSLAHLPLEDAQKHVVLLCELGMQLNGVGYKCLS